MRSPLYAEMKMPKNEMYRKRSQPSVLIIIRIFSKEETMTDMLVPSLLE